MRAFIAIEIPSEVKEELGFIQNKLKEFGLEARYPPLSNLHITLKFLGNIEEDKLPQIKKLLEEISFNSFSIELTYLGGFPDLRRPRILWVGLKPQEKLKSLMERIEEKLKEAGFTEEKREPSFHITLARIKYFHNIHLIKEKLTQVKVKNLNWQIERIGFFKSTLTPQAPIYTNLFTINLKT